MPKTYKIAIIQFPGLNCETETKREIDASEMNADIVRWNDDPKKLRAYDGFVIPGGFSYEDRGRAGIIAALDPIMNTIAAETERGKPCLGICNGAQILVESGLVPGVAKGVKAARAPMLSLAKNKRVSDGHVQGTGYYNAWIYMKPAAASLVGRNAFMGRLNPNEPVRVPVAHAEGRFVSEIEGLFDTLMGSGQIAFVYCDRDCNVIKQFPVNPNGASHNIAGITNFEGNVMALMPHPERSDASQLFFLSMKDYLEKKKLFVPKKKPAVKALDPLLGKYQRGDSAIECLTDLIITDYEAQTFEQTISQLGFPGVTVERQTHYEIDLKKTSKSAAAKNLRKTGALYNTNKEEAVFVPVEAKDGKPAVREGVTTYSLLVRDRFDDVGAQLTETLPTRFGLKEVKAVTRGTLWHVSFPGMHTKKTDDEMNKLIDTHLFFNPHGQEAFWY